MSDIGLYSNLYQQICQLSEMIDSALISLKSQNSSRPTNEYKTLGEWLLKLCEDNQDNLSIRQTALLIADSEIDRKAIKHASANLLHHKIDDKAVETLEHLAAFLMKEQSKAIAKMDGRKR